MAMDLFRASPLPNPPAQYDPQYMRQFLRVIEIYFSQLDSGTANNAEKYTANQFVGGTYSGLQFSGGDFTGNEFSGDAFNGATFTGGYFTGDGTGLQVPYNQFYSLQNQTAAAIDEAYALKLEETTFADNISITGVDNTQITFSKPGIYTLTFSLSFKNPTNDRQDIDIWFRYNNGVTTADVPNSNSKFSISARKSTSDPSYLIAVTAFTGYAEAEGVWVEIMWRVSNTAVEMEYIPEVTYSAGVTPSIPATPSAIVQANFISKAV